VTKQIAAELAALEINGLRLSAQTVVMWAATHERSALHAYFEWDNRKAGAAYRLQQASDLILRVRVEVQTPALRTIRVVSKHADEAGRMFRPVPKITTESKLNQHSLHSALRELKRLRQKYAHLSELSALFQQLDAMAREHESPNPKSRQAG
jgi:hypothetical protein